MNGTSLLNRSICFVDINECATGQNECHGYALCTNTYSSYVCRCLKGYRGDGRTCEGKDVFWHHSCQSRNWLLWTITRGTKQQTINQTELWSKLPLNDMVFHFISYTDGMELSWIIEKSHLEVNFRVWFSDRYPGSLLISYNLFLIADINECDEGTADCVNGAECINVNGSYTCQCPVGFQKTADNCTGVQNLNRDLHVCTSLSQLQCKAFNPPPPPLQVQVVFRGSILLQNSSEGR